MKDINLGKIKVWIDVARWYYGLIMQTVTGFGILKLLGLSWYILAFIFIAMIPVIIFIVYLHMTYIYPKEVSYTWDKNPMFHKLMEKK